MRLGRTIFGPDGRVLLSAGVALQPSYLARLRSMGYSSVYISDGIHDDMELPEVIGQETRARATQAVRSVMEGLAPAGQTKGKRSLDSVYQAVSEMVDQILSAKELQLGLTDIKALDDYLFAHSVNTATVAIMIGRKMGLPPSRLVDLGIGCMLHDIGKCHIRQDILQKPAGLTPEEIEEVQRHAAVGFEFLRLNFDLSMIAAHVAFQHHERMDGSGYPRGLKGEEILDVARIAAVADVFDAVTSDQVYRKKASYDQALQLLQKEAGSKLDPGAVRALLDFVAPYPLATLVRLNTGETALVVALNLQQMGRPQVKLVKDPRGNSYGTSGALIDLSKVPEVEIQEAL